MVIKTGGGPVVGLDIGTSFIKAVEVRPGKRPQVSALGIMPTPPDTFAGDIIVDPSALGFLIRKLLDESGITARRVVSVVSGQTSFVMRVLPLPKMTAKELGETMKFEVERQVPFPSNDIVMDYKPLVRADEPADSPEMNVLLVVGQQQMIDAHVETLLAAGLEPVALDVEPLAAIRALLDASLENQTVALVNLGASKTDLAIFERGVMVLPRPIPVAGDAFTQAISGALGRPRDEAESLKKEMGEVSLEMVGAQASGGPQGGAEDPQESEFSFFDMSGPGFGEASPAPDAPVGLAAEPAAEAPPISGFTFDDEPGSAAGSFFALEDEPAAPAAPAPSAFALEEDEPRAFSFGDSSTTSTPQPLSAEPATPGSPAPPVEHPLAQLPESERVRRQVMEALAPVVGDLVTEIRRSLEFYRSRSAEGVIHRICLCGGSAKLKNLDRYLEQELGAPVQVIEPSQKMDATGKNASPRYFSEVAPLLAVGVGLGLRDMVEFGPALGAAPKAPKAPKAQRAKKG
ncbi:MAG TPA: type IV pilus assembly protein PilM [Armatimonadota bacterium]